MSVDNNENVGTSSFTMNEEEYNDFLRCVINLKEVCNDIDIRGGFIRQRTNDKTSIFQIDLTEIVDDATFTLSDVKQKLDLLKIFAGQDVTVDIVEGPGGHFTFSDQFSSLKIMNPTYSFVDNKFMTEDELEAIFTINDDELILEYDLPRKIVERIRVITSNFNLNSIQVEFDGEAASIKTGDQSKNQFAKFTDNIPTNVIIEKCSANLGVIPFGIDQDEEVTFKMYKMPEQTISLNTFQTMIGDCDMMIFTRSSLIKDDNE